MNRRGFFGTITAALGAAASRAKGWVPHRGTSVSWGVKFDDDLAAFADVPAQFGAAARAAQEQTVLQILTAAGEWQSLGPIDQVHFTYDRSSARGGMDHVGPRPILLPVKKRGKRSRRRSRR